MGSLPSSNELRRQIMITINVAWRNRLESKVIEQWLNNFTGEAIGDVEYERNLALWLLYNFTYINEEEVKHLCRLLFRKYIHLSIGNQEITEENIIALLQKSTFLPLGRSSESGSYVLYMFRQENDIPVVFFGDNNSIDANNTVVLIDDMTLSGDQATWNIAKIKYGDYRLKDPLSDRFMMFVNKELDLSDIQTRVIDHIKSNCDDKNKVLNDINDHIVRNASFYEDAFSDWDYTDVNPTLKKLISRYVEDRGNMSNYAIFKMNRLLLEQAFPEEIPKSREIIPNERIILLTFFASDKAKSKLAADSIQVINCIDLDDMSKVFSEVSMAFSEYETDKQRCREMCEYYGRMIKPDMPLGYKDCQYLIGLYYSIPNNTLPIFWGNSNWNPLFVRHEKNYGGTINVNGRFI